MVYHSLKAIVESKNKHLTPAELIKIHLKDPSHVITDEELQKVKIGFANEEMPDLENETTVNNEAKPTVYDKDNTIPYVLMDF